MGGRAVALIDSDLEQGVGRSAQAEVDAIGMRGATRAAVGWSAAWRQDRGRPTVDVVHHGLAVGLALASAVCYAVSAALQHHEAARQTGNGLHLVRALLRRPVWCAAVLASLLGALLHVGALGAGPLVLVQPLGVTALVFALPIGARLGRIRVSARSWLGAACVAVGLPAVLSLVPHHPGLAPGVTSYGTAVLVIAVLVGVTVPAAALLERSRPRPAGVLYALGAALSFGLASGIVKAVWLGRAVPTLIAAGLVAMVAGIVLAQHAYRATGLGAPLAVLTLADPITAAAIGVLVLGEPVLTSPPRLAVGLAGFACTAAGVALLSAPRAARRAQDGPLAPPNRSRVA